MIQREKSLNKGLEEISHYFISAPLSEERKRGAVADPFRPETAPGKRKRILPVLSTCSDIPTSFFTCHLGLAIARSGRDVFVIDIEKRQPNVESQFGLKPVALGLSDILYPSENKLFRNVEPRLRVLDIRLDLGALPSPQRERDKKLVEMLSREEKLSEWVLINLPRSGAMVLQNLEWASRIRELVIFMDARSKNRVESYTFIKALFARMPELRIYLGVCDVSSAEEAKEIYNKMETGTERFLGKSLVSVGYILKDPVISQSVYEQIPLTRGSFPLVQNALGSMVRILDESDAPDASFFSTDDIPEKKGFET